MQPSKRQRKNASAMKLVGALVARFRNAAALTQSQLADQACVQVETIASIEQGRRPLKPDLACHLDRLLDTKGAGNGDREHAGGGPDPGLGGNVHGPGAGGAGAVLVRQPGHPGLLQTESYARAVFRNRVPVFSEEEISAQTSARLERQEILRRPSPPTISMVIWEPVLMLQLVADQDHGKQLRHLRGCAHLAGVCLQVLSLNHRAHAGLDGPFTLVETPDYQRIAYSETQRGSQLVSDPDEVSILSQKYAMLRAQALSPEDTLGLLDRLVGEQ